MGKSVNEIMDLSLEEFSLWLGFMEAESKEHTKVEIMLARVCCLIQNKFRGKAEKALTPKDFLISSEEPEKENPEVMMYKMDLIFHNHNKSKQKRK